MRFIAFDLETAAILGKDERLEDNYHRLGISVVSTLLSSEVQPCVWYDPDQGRLSKEGTCVLVQYFMAMREKGYISVGWNSASFDWRILAHVSDMWPECRLLALEHYDPMFQFFCERGFPVGLQKVSMAMGCSGKTEGMHGDLVPKMWADGQREEVKKYVAQDARLTAEVFCEIKKRNAIAWYTRDGDLRSHKLVGGLLTVQEAMKLPEPDVGWMDNYWGREKFTSWLVDSV